MDFSKLKQQVIVAIRGKNSQMEFSRKLGFSYNQVHKWESNQKTMKWSEFVKICQTGGVNLQKIFENYVYKYIDVNDYRSVLHDIQIKYGKFSVTDLANKLNTSESTIRRWLNGSSEPTVEDIFAYFYWYTKVLIDLISNIVEINNVPMLQTLFKYEKRIKEAEGELPYACAVEACFSLKSYKSLEKHSDDFLVKKTGLTEDQVKLAIQRLIEIESIELKNNKYHLISRRVDMDFDIINSAKLGKYWTEKSLQRFNTIDGVPNSDPSLNNMWSYRVFPLSEKTEKLVLDCMKSCYGEIMSIIENDIDDNKDKVKVLTMHLFGIKDTMNNT